MTRDTKTLDEMRADLHGLVHFACDTSTACDVVTAIDALLAAARAEALEEAAKLADAESDECGRCGHANEGSEAADRIAKVIRALVALDEAGIKCMSYKEARPHFTGILDRAIKAEGRAAELEAALRALCAEMPRCQRCQSVATRGYQREGQYRCDPCTAVTPLWGVVPDLPHAAALRAALLLLAKGGKP